MTANRKPIEAVRTALERIEAGDKAHGAFVRVLEREALGEAAALEAAVAAGRPQGPLHGLPIAVKDIIDLAGQPTQCGSLTRKDAPPADADAPVVARLRAAGAVVVGKTATVEYAFGGYGTNLTLGTPRNPWDRKVHRVPGGSSSGTGIAVGAGWIPAGLGTDTGGSVRSPAGWCGCVGLKTSIGLVGRSRIAPLSQALDTVGPLTNSVRLAAEMLAVMQGHDPDDPSTHGVRPVDPLSAIDRGAQGLRIGAVAEADMPLLSADMRQSYAKALTLLKEAGATVVPLSLPRPLDELTSGCGDLIALEAYVNWRPLVEDPKAPLGPPVRTRMEHGRTLKAADMLVAERRRRETIAALLARIDRLDAFVMPTTPFAAIPLDKVDETRPHGGAHTRFVNYLELAALSVPIGLTPERLPASLQIVVRLFDDPLALRIGQAFEAARGAWTYPG